MKVRDTRSPVSLARPYQPQAGLIRDKENTGRKSAFGGFYSQWGEESCPWRRGSRNVLLHIHLRHTLFFSTNLTHTGCLLFAVVWLSLNTMLQDTLSWNILGKTSSSKSIVSDSPPGSLCPAPRLNPTLRWLHSAPREPGLPGGTLP